MFKPAGRHALLDGWRAAPAVLADGDFLVEAISRAAMEGGATVRNRFVERFAPGVSVTVVLAESHATIHTYPEAGVYMADVFTCGSTAPGPIAKAIAAIVGGKFRVRLVKRGPPRLLAFGGA